MKYLISKAKYFRPKAKPTEEKKSNKTKTANNTINTNETKTGRIGCVLFFLTVGMPPFSAREFSLKQINSCKHLSQTQPTKYAYCVIESADKAFLFNAGLNFTLVLGNRKTKSIVNKT